MIELNYVACNWDSIYMACGLLLSMTITLFILKVSAFSEIYTTEGIAVPIFFYFGDKRAVRATVERMTRPGGARVSKENFDGSASAKSYATARELFAHYIGDPIRDLSNYRTRLSSMNDAMIQSYSDAQIRAKLRAQELGEKLVADFGTA
jgi:hypothetical protein